MAITQSPASDKPHKSQVKKSRVVASIWLIMALLSGAAALALWMFSSAPAFDSEAQQEEEPPEVAAFNIAQVTAIDQLDELSADVHPISFDALIRDLRDYPPEFKDSTYLKKNKGKWTLQVMDVSEHEIISDYLNSRDDRKKFAYFRYRDSENKPRYILTYDALSSEKAAQKEASSVDFELPANVQVIPEKMDSYLDVIETYELTGPIKDLSKNRVRQVKLQPTKRELAARRRASEVRQQQQQQQRNEERARRQRSEQETAEPATETNIRTSNDSSDTLAVQEQRRVVVPDSQRQSNNDNANNSEQAPRGNNQPQPPESRGPAAGRENQNAEKPRAEPVEPKKPQEKPKAADNAQKPANAGTANNAEVDQIKQLIEEKTQ
ncbi:hypothetical protein [Psychrobacter sp. FDAARGOS_221]|uniref:hypothetical protein n=1 Tax=Psychrobacter sp. FDAARGOS_221 TaxID=1975705 RepID=UPI000BB56138|nr:hypothetical protein [Psychrobacter sp. FDAARGOS_221]PNK60355.1 hypothetical protein A6J60_005355 [Psychrobacter sp. FDAARGOS_221]